MTIAEETIFNQFLFKLMECAAQDQEDIHEFQFSTQECKDLLNAMREN